MRRSELFLDLPAALVEELLAKTPALCHSVVSQLTTRRAQRSVWRQRLQALGLLGRSADLPLSPTPTSCGIDGSVTVERLLAHDLLVAGAVAVEGLTPPSEQRFWPEPRHRVWVELERHTEANDVLARSVMAGLEVELAAQAPHEVVFLDGSLATPLIAFDQAVRLLAELPEPIASGEFFLTRLPDWLATYARILGPSDTARCWVAVPKYTTRRDIASLLAMDEPIDDRALLTSLLEPGEFTWPIPLVQARRPHSFGVERLPPALQQPVENLVTQVLTQLSELRAIYVRPHRWLPAIRVELHESGAADPHCLARVLEAVRFQSSTGALVEPFPLFLADRMVRHLRRAARALRHTVREAAAREYPVFEEVFLALESYRSEAFRSP